MKSDFQATVSFRKSSSLFLASIFLSLPVMILLILLTGPVTLEEWVPALVVLVPLFTFTVPYFIQEKRRHKELRIGGQGLGFFFNDEALLLRTSEKTEQLIPHASLRKFELHGRPLKLGWLADWMELSGDGFCVRMTFPDDYKLMELLRFLRAWKPALVLKIDENLTRYDEYVSLAPKGRLQAVPDGLVEAVEKGGMSNLDAFKALLDAAHIHYKKVHDRQSGMIDAPEAWVFDYPLELRVRDAVAVFPELKIEGQLPDEFLRFTEYPFNEDWVFEFTWSLPNL